MKKLIIVLVLALGFCRTVSAAEWVVRHVRPESVTDQRQHYYLAMMRLALEKTRKTDGPFRLAMAKETMSQARAMKQLEENLDVDIIWTMTSREREKKLRPIRIPLLKGLLGYRVFIIRKEDESRFAAVWTWEALKKLKAGQGKDWPDTKILRANGIPVEGCVKYKGLFRMLRYKRFDYFPRGVNEIWEEARTHRDEDLAVEKTLLLKYPAPIYFFVNKNNIELAKRLEKGLLLAIQDGSFAKLFRNHPSNRPVFELAQMEKRKLFLLKNPLLPEKTPLWDKALWYSVEDEPR